MTAPVLDWSRFDGGDRAGVVADPGRACRDTGGFLRSGQGIDPGLPARVFAAADAFFDLPDDAKVPLSILRSPHDRGRATGGAERLDETFAQIDREAAFDIGLDHAPDDPRVMAGEPFRGVNVRPDPPGFRETVLAYCGAVRAPGVDQHRAIAPDLFLPEGFFAPHLDAPLATLRLLRYRPGTGEAKYPPVTGAGYRRSRLDATHAREGKA